MILPPKLKLFCKLLQMKPSKLSSKTRASKLPPETFVVNDPKSAAFLSDPEHNGYFCPFLEREVTLSEVALELQVPLNKLHYWVTKMLELGLIRVTRVQKRAGRAVRHYSAVAPAFFVPFAVIRAETFEAQLTLEDVSRQRRLSSAHARARGELPLEYGTLIARMGGANSGIRIEPFPKRRSDDLTLNVWLERPFCAEDARALLAELRALEERYSGLPEPRVGTGKPFCLRLALAPI
jgi:hypothetical protein